MSVFTEKVGDVAGSAKEYLDLRLDDLKLRTVKGLSITLNRVLSLMLVLFAASIVMLALAVGLIFLIGDAIGSMAGGAFIVAGIFAVLAFVLYLLRDKLFTDSMVRMLVGIFFDDGMPSEKEAGK